MNLLLIKILSYQFLSIALLMLLSKKGAKKGLRFLALFLLFKGIALLSFQLKGFIRVNPIYSIIFKTSFWIYPPLIWLYTYKLIHTNLTKLKRKIVISFIPSLIYLIYLSVKYILWQNNITRYVTRTEDNLFDLGYYALMFFFLTKSLIAIKEKKNSVDFVNEYQWLRNFLVGFLVVWVAFALENIFGAIGFSKDIQKSILNFALVLLFICTNLIIWYALNMPSIFQFQKYTKKASGYKLSDKDYKKYTYTIQQFMESNRPYLNSEINLELFSKQIGIHQRIISKVINSAFNQNFFGFINSYRIKEAKKALENPTNNQTILEILYSAGYNNKSVFNTSFKKETGLTPTEYRSRYKSDILKKNLNFKVN
jgi:AraC-like DNA-binding protein